jgi:hypothetical protein
MVRRVDVPRHLAGRQAVDECSARQRGEALLARVGDGTRDVLSPEGIRLVEHNKANPRARSGILCEDHRAHIRVEPNAVVLKSVDPAQIARGGGGVRPVEAHNGDACARINTIGDACSGALATSKAMFGRKEADHVHSARKKDVD